VGKKEGMHFRISKFHINTTLYTLTKMKKKVRISAIFLNFIIEIYMWEDLPKSGVGCFSAAC
jgi:hypothetical protein